jgi:hypothetical protein
MRPAHYSHLLFILFATISFGCREDVVEELESYGVKREWIPFAPGAPLDRNYTQIFIEGASPWMVTQVVAKPYMVTIAAEARSGKKALQISTDVADPGSIWINRFEELSDLLGKRIRFSGYVKPTDWKGTVEAGYMSDFAKSDLQKISFTEPIVRNKWTKFTTEIDLPSTTEYLSLVLEMNGTGTIYIDDCSIEVIGVSEAGAPSRDLQAVHPNLGFEDGDLPTQDHWSITDSLQLRMPYWWPYYEKVEYQLVLDSVEPHSGRYAAGFVTKSAQPRSSTMLVRTFEVELLRGHRVRFSVWLKTNDLNGLVTFEAVTRDEQQQNAEVKRLWDLHGDSDWKEYSLEIDVPMDATGSRVDIGYYGTGSLLIDDLSFEKIERLPNTGSMVDKSIYFAKQFNLGFENE